MNRILLTCVGVMVALGVGVVFFERNLSAKVTMSTQYQAVLLSNGSAYFGKLQGLGTPFPVLTDVSSFPTSGWLRV